MSARTLKRTIRLGAALAAGLSLPVLAQIPAGDWWSYGRDPGGRRFSPLTQITPANVGKLATAWTFELRPAESTTTRINVSQAGPIAAGGVVYVPTPYGRIAAVDGDSGRELWSFAIPGGDQPGGRSLEYWDGAGKAPPRLYFGTRRGLLMAIDAATGKPSAAFQTIDLKTPEVMEGMPEGAYQINSAPVVVGDVIVTGSKVQESPALGPNGDVRGWDVRTGKLLWTFHTVPRPGEFGHDTWAGDGWKRRSGVNVWSLMSADKERGIIYLPLAAPSYDRVGIDRKGANLFSSSLVAVDARTGKRLWHFQLVHHDIWDLDTPVQPTLVDVKRGGKTIPAIVTMSKTGLVFILDRVTGKPLHEVREVPVMPSTIPGEEAWPTQPMPVAPPPISRIGMTADDISTLTPEHAKFCKDRVAAEGATFAKFFEPIRADRPTIRFPGSGGGVNWGGGAYDASRSLFIINTLDMASDEQMGQDAQGNWTNINRGGFFMNRSNRWMCQSTPWGSLVAVDVSKGTIAWSSTLGVTDSAPAGKQATGRPSVGGPIVTAGGLVFIGATDDGRFRAFDAKGGKELWTFKLPASAHTTPITYRGKSGKQYVAIVAAGGSYLNSAATASQLLSFALPD